MIAVGDGTYSFGSVTYSESGVNTISFQDANNAVSVG
jgi:hypothetical protein